MFAPQNLTPEERDWLKITALGAFVTGVIGAAIEIGKDEIKELLKKRMERANVQGDQNRQDR